MHDTYEQLADLLEYPEQRGLALARAACASDDVSAPLTDYMRAVTQLSLPEFQELYTRTFDLNPVCALEIGYHLFGENYKRGEFLANLRETEAPFDLGQEHQLPDYLPVLLRLLTRLDDKELHDSLISECLIPGIDKMLGSLKDTENPYRELLDVIRATLQLEVPVVSTPATTFNMRAHLPVIQSLGG